MTQTNRLDRRLVFTAMALAALMVLMAGCGQRRTPSRRVVVKPISPSAQLSYDYLVYQDRLQRLQRHASLGKRSPLTREEVNTLHTQVVESVDKLIKAMPSPQLYLEKASLFWNHPDGTSRSRAVLKEGLVAYPDDRVLTVYLANSYVADDRVGDGIAVMNGYLGRHQDDIEARERLGQMLMDADRDAEALDVLKKIPVAKRSPDALYGIGRVQGNLGMRKAAIANLKKAVEMDAGFTEALVELAYQYELSKDYASAETIYSSILDQSDSFPEARLRLINLNLKLNNPSKALEYALDGPPSKSFIMDAVQTFIADGFYAQGSTVLDMLTSGGEVPAEFHFYKAVIAVDGENDNGKALEHLGQVKETDRLYPHALSYRAQILGVQGKDREAMDIAARGKEMFPDSTIFYTLEADLRRAANDLAGAERSLKQGLSRLKGDPELTYRLALLYETMGRRPEGLALMETVIRAHPDHAQALNYVGYTLAEENRELDRALVLVKKASSLEPESGAILDSVAWVYYRKKNFVKAWNYIRRAVDFLDDDPVIWEHYGDIAAALGKKKEAGKGYRNSLRLDNPKADKVKEKLRSL